MAEPNLEQILSGLRQRTGTCPECHETSGYLNVHKTHWFFCEEHKTVWGGGYNLFSSWQDETEADWQANAEKLSDYREVKASAWGWSEVPMQASALLSWFRDWRNYLAWNLYGYRLHKWRVRRGTNQRQVRLPDELPF